MSRQSDLLNIILLDEMRENEEKITELENQVADLEDDVYRNNSAYINSRSNSLNQAQIKSSNKKELKKPSNNSSLLKEKKQKKSH